MNSWKKGHLIFYKDDLEKCGLDVSEGSVYSGLCTEIFQKEKAACQSNVYSFVHFSVQEFIAALYVFFITKTRKQTHLKNPGEKNYNGNCPKSHCLNFIKLQSTRLYKQEWTPGPFLRFLLGL